MSCIIEGAKKAINADFKIKEPKIVQNAVEACREDNDWLVQFRGCLIEICIAREDI